MNYFFRERDDQKWDILEGTADDPGRVVTTVDTEAEATTYIAEQDAVFDELFDRITEDESDDIEPMMAAMDDEDDDEEDDDVPYKLAMKNGKTCVVKKEGGEVVKCHDDREKAVAHLKALYVNKADASVQAAVDELGPDTPEEPVIVGDGGPELFIPKKDGVVVPMMTTSSTGNLTTTTIQAHAEPAAPPADHFSDPGFTQLERFVTITEDGRFMTHIAGWGECHVGYGDMCVTAPREADYSHFAVGTTLTSDGASIPTGVIAIKGGHADISLDASSARSHYDDTSAGAVDVVLGTDDFGIWASGSLRPGTSPEQVRILRASGVSGDWRLIEGELRLVGICAVNVPGFPKLAMAASADGITALVAAGGPPVPHPDLCDCKDSTQDILDEIDAIHRLLADALIEDKAISNLSARIMDEHEIESLYARIAT